MGTNETTQGWTVLKQKLAQVSVERSECSIYRVHRHLRNVNPQTYEPEVIAIGPYHRDKDPLKMMEEQKLRYLHLLLQRKNENVEKYASTMSPLESKALKCYAEPISLDATEFVEMLVLDGCFIIELVPNRHSRLTYLLLNFFNDLYPGKVYRGRTEVEPDEIKHLLDLIKQGWCPPLLPAFIEAKMIGKEWQFISSAARLREANVKFERNDAATGFNIEFNNGSIVMESLTIEDRTESVFRNLIAHEQYFEDSSSILTNFMTDYVRLLDCLIDSPKDVEILCENGIMENWLGDDEVVAKMVNRLADSVAGPGSYFIYARVFGNVNKHCGKRRNRWMAKLRRNYLNSPWPIISIIVALILLLLTVTQTLFTILQVV